MFEFFGEVQKQSRTNIAMELRKAFVFWKVGVPYTNSLINVKLTRQIATDPSVGEGDEIDFKLFQMYQAFRIGLLD